MDPIIRLIPVCPETKRGEVKPYEFGQPCAKCGKKLIEGDAWEAIAWKNEARIVKFLCQRCAKRAIKYYAR